MAIAFLADKEQCPFIKINAKTAKVQVDDKEYDKISLLMDMETADVGYICFSAGKAPEYHMLPLAAVTAGAPLPPRPPEKDSQGKPLFKPGFRMQVKLPIGSPPAPRVCVSWPPIVWRSGRRSTSFTPLGSKPNRTGKVPVVTLDGWTKVSGQKGPQLQSEPSNFEVRGPAGRHAAGECAVHTDIANAGDRRCT